MKSLAHISLAIGLCTSALLAETLEDYAPLLQNSPFLSQAFKDRLAKSEALGVNNYSFNGYTKIGEEWQICLINKQDRLATWITINEEIEGYKLTNFNHESHALTFEKGSITILLGMDNPNSTNSAVKVVNSTNSAVKVVNSTKKTSTKTTANKSAAKKRNKKKP